MLLYVSHGLFEEGNNRMCNGVEFSMMQLKSLFFRPLYKLMLAFGCIQFSSLSDFIDQLNFACIFTF
jgi:hypothetical protein